MGVEVTIEDPVGESRVVLGPDWLQAAADVLEVRPGRLLPRVAADAVVGAASQGGKDAGRQVNARRTSGNGEWPNETQHGRPSTLSLPSPAFRVLSRTLGCSSRAGPAASAHARLLRAHLQASPKLMLLTRQTLMRSRGLAERLKRRSFMSFRVTARL